MTGRKWMWLGCVFACSTAWVHPVTAQDWPNWRGPSHSGFSEATGLPEQFDRETNVRWKTSLPGPGASTPIIVGDQVFLTAVDVEANDLRVICLDRLNGEVLWEESATEDDGIERGLLLHPRSNFASPSPVSDGQRVVFFFGSGDLTAFDLDGERLWSRNLQKDYGDFCFQWTFSSSPTLWKGRLYLQILQRNEPVGGRGVAGAESFLLALNPDTGEELFRHVRPSVARKESLESYATPIPYTSADGREELLVVGGDVVSGHEPTTGEELWRWGTWNEGHREMWWRVVPTPVVAAGKVLVCAPKRAPVYAVQLGGDGELDASALAWQSEGRRNPVTSDVPTPLSMAGHFFVLSDMASALSKVDAADGKVVWTIDMPGKHLWRASPTGADGRIYCMNHAGELVVIDADSGKVLHETLMAEEDSDQIRSCIAIAHQSLFVRTHEWLYCVASPTTEE